MVADKEVKYFLIPSGRGFGGPDGSSNKVIEWIRENGKEITNAEWNNSPEQNGSGQAREMGDSNSLYKIQGTQDNE